MNFQRILFISILLFGFACKKHGCRSKVASNYDPKAKKYDRTCLYDSQGVLYWDTQSYNNMIERDITHITAIFNHDTVYHHIDINSIAATDNPSCEDASWFQFKRVNYDNEFEVGLMVIDQNSDTVFANAITLLPGCNSYLIEIN